MKMTCEDCGKRLVFGIDGICPCGKELCYECFKKNHRDTCEKKE